MPFGNLIPRLRRPFGGVLDPFPFRGQPFGVDEGPMAEGFRPMANINEGFTLPALPVPRPTPTITPRPRTVAEPAGMSSPAMAPATPAPQGRGFLGGLDPLTLAMFLAPIAELTKHGAGSAMYTAAIQGKHAQMDAEERRQERQSILQERADAKAARDEERAARAKEREEDRLDRDEEREIRRKEREQRLLPREETPSERLAREKFEHEKERDERRAAAGDKSPDERMKRLRGEVRDRAKTGVNTPANRQRIKQIAGILGVDPKVYLDELDAAAKDRGVRTANVQARTNRANRPPVRGGGRGGARRTNSPMSDFYK